MPKIPFFKKKNNNNNNKCFGLTNGLAVGLVTNFHYFFLFQKEGHYGHFNKKLVKLKRTKTWEINFI
jgi:hypothetical protein